MLFAGEIIEHLPRPLEALRKWSDLLRPGGYLVISAPNRMFNKPNEEHISLLTIGEMKKMLRELNFEVVQIIGIDIFNPFLDLFLNKVVKCIPKFSPICDKIFQIKMRLTFRLPWLANNIVYVTKKR